MASNKKWHATGTFCMVRVVNVIKTIELINPTQDDKEPVGVLCSAGKLCQFAGDLIGQEVWFNPTMQVTQFGNPKTDEFIYILVPEVAIQSVMVSE